MKHFHMLMAAITVVLFLWQSYWALSSDKRLNKKEMIATHIIYTLLLISGIIMAMSLMALNVPLQWVVAKIILLVAAISASIKAFRPNITRAQKKAGIMVAFIAYIGILVLAFVKPDNFI